MALSPAPASAHESRCTLRFAALVSQCHLGKPTKHVATVADADAFIEALGKARQFFA